jgi:uncharacterized protein YecE (DUF72 family)
MLFGIEKTQSQPMIQWHIGCSGFHYKHWKETFYPKGLPQRKWFEYYCTQFNTLELNVTFYRFPQVEILKGWYQKSPDNFSFSVKAPRLITHYKKLNDCEKLLSDFYNTVQEGLQAKAGCILFQFPPKFGYMPERLEKIISSLHPELPNVVEFRDAGWWNETVYKTLAENNITFSGMSHPLLPDKIIVDHSLLYYRMHGVPQLYFSPYEMNELRSIIKKIQSSKKVKKAFIYFNNDIGGNAVKNAKEMIALLTK